MGLWRAAYEVDTSELGGRVILPLYVVTGALPTSVTSTRVRGTTPVQLPVGVTAGAAVVVSLVTSAPWNP
jgi:hypothetical protein